MNQQHYHDHDYGVAAPQPRAAARPDPEGVTILDGHRRVGNAQRDTYLDHLSELQGRGYFHGSEEFEARQAAVQKAETEYDLNRLISDLPGLVQPSPGSVKRAVHSPVIAGKFLHDNYNQTWFRWVLHTLIAMLAVAIAVIPTSVLGYWGSRGGFAHAMIVLFAASGFILFVVNIIAGCFWADNH